MEQEPMNDEANAPDRPMPAPGFVAYIGTKLVNAMKICAIQWFHEPGHSYARLTGSDFETHNAEKDWMEKHEPEEGGYIVMYKDGYTSFSPAEAFEEAYVLTTDGLTFGNVIDGLVKSSTKKQRYARNGWNGANMYIALQTPSPESMMTLPYIYMYTVQGGHVPWLASQTDMLSKDWVRVS